jgi:cellulose synthase/poly-beta-1,6-N-acetylglucosamine synthase-like glycosyltransferase
MIPVFIFWLSLGILLYVFFGFVVILWLVSPFRRKFTKQGDATPSVSVIVCAFNEQKHMHRKIVNCLELDYPKDRLEIIVISDGSTDATDQILEDIGSTRVKAHRMAKQVGKAECQNFAAGIARHDLLFFTDATVMHPPDALNLLVRNFADPTVGCVTGKPVFKRDHGAASLGQTKREKYELYLRTKLGETWTLFGAQDCIYVIPSRLYAPVRGDLDSGFVGPLKLLERGYRTVYEPEAIASVDRPAPSMRDEFTRRSRIALRGMRGLIHMRHLMNPCKYGFVALSLISTRLLRWLSPIFLVMLLISNLVLLDSSFYLWTFLVQVVFYVTACVAFLFAQKGYRLKLPFYVPLYFCILACSATVGLKRLLAGETGQIWQTRR